MSDEINKSLLIRMADSRGVDQGKFMNTLKATILKQRDGSVPTNEQIMAFLLVAERYDLDPFCREICAFPDKQNGIKAVVTVDGWIKLLNKQPTYRGFKVVFTEEQVRMEGAKVDCPISATCFIYIEGRDHPIGVPTFLDESYRPPMPSKNGGVINGPWQTHTKTMLFNRAVCRGARFAFSFGGITELDEAEHIQEIEVASTFDVSDGKELTQEIDIEKLESILFPLVERAQAQNAWQPIYTYVDNRLSGDELKYAQIFIRSAEAQHHRFLKKSSEETKHISEHVAPEDIPQTPIPLFTDEVVVSDVVEATV